MNSREKILQAIRELPLADVELPDLQRNEWIRYDDPVEQFAATLPAVGGQAVRCAATDLQQRLQSLPQFNDASRVCSLLSDIGGNVDLGHVDDPHELEDLDFVLARGEFGVAENGAIWITDKDVRHRSVYFVAQHVGIVLSTNEIVNNMHEAYARLQLAQVPVEQRRFGVFISGPSKTADIEQSLVIGAHGPRSLTVFLLD